MTSTLLTGEIGTGLQVGIDWLYFQADNYDTFKGIKAVPAGRHLVHITDPISNTRVGKWIDLQAGDVVAIKTPLQTDEEDCPSGLGFTLEFTHLRGRPIAAQDYVFMTPYRGSELSELLDVPWERYAAEGTGGAVSSEDCTPLESAKLNGAMQRQAKRLLGQQPERAAQYVGEIERGLGKLGELRLQTLDLTDKRTLVRDGSTGAQRTLDYLDRSWLVRAKYGTLAQLLDEWRFSFAAAAALGNPGAYLQWQSLTDTVLRSVGILNSERQAARAFLRELALQLTVAGRMRGTDVQDEEDAAEQATADESLIVDFKPLQPAFQELLDNLDDVDSVEFRAGYSDLISRLNLDNGGGGNNTPATPSAGGGVGAMDITQQLTE